MKKLILLFTILLMFSCKDNQKPSTESVENQTKAIVKDDILTISMEVRTKEDDKFELYYTDDSPESGFSADKRMASYVKGSDAFQNVSFVLPKEVWPYKLRLDVGDNNNKYETPVEIKSVVFKLNNNRFEIDQSIMGSFFENNVYLEVITNGYMRKVVDGKYDPFLIARPILIKRMELEL